MNFELKSMYSFMISHTFPGALLLVEIFLYYYWLVDAHILESFQRHFPTETSSIVLLMILAYALSTLLGVILDGIHHLLFEDLFRKSQVDQKFTALKDSYSLEVYRHFIEDDLWYFYEAYANLGLAMLPGLGLLWHWLSSRLQLSGLYFWGTFILYVSVVIMLFLEAIYIYKRCLRDEEEFIKEYSKRKSKP